MIDQYADHSFESLENVVVLPYEQLRECRDKAFEFGYDLEDAIIAKRVDRSSLKQTYLKQLRTCERLQKKIQLLHAQALQESMKRDENSTFEALVQLPLPPRPSLKRDVLAFYEGIRAKHTVPVLESLRREAELEAESREQMAEEYAAYEKHLKVLAKAEAERLRRLMEPSKRRNVVVYTEEVDGGYKFHAQNFNLYHVTVTLGFKTLKNLVADRNVPYTFELAPKSERDVLYLHKKEAVKSVTFEPYVGVTMGSVSAKHADVFYRFPFKKGSTVNVSQGFNGKTSHKNKYAVDFAVPVGTPILAARSGIVVAAQEANTKGRNDKKYRVYANYIIIEHNDKTLGKYYHLKHNGVSVTIGDQVQSGQLIGYSGNTGYTSGPHLHFSVSKVDPNNPIRPLTVPFCFKNGAQIVENPKKGNRFTVE